MGQDKMAFGHGALRPMPLWEAWDWVACRVLWTGLAPDHARALALWAKHSDVDETVVVRKAKAGPKALAA